MAADAERGADASSGTGAVARTRPDDGPGMDWQSLVARDASARSHHESAAQDAEAAPAGANASAQDPALAPVVERMQSNLADAASDPKAFHALLEKSFGKGYDRVEAESIRQQTLAGDFGWMPRIEVVSAATLADTSGTQGAGQGQAAYSAETDTVYVSEELLASGTDAAVATLTEEVGHALDARLNTSDAAGDEGEIFSRLVGGEDLSAGELDALHAENDHGTIEVNGRTVEVEYNFFKKLAHGVGDAFKSVGKAIGGAVHAVGKAVGDVAHGIVDVAKDAWKTVMTSKLVGQIAMVAQFIPIPAVALAARAVNVARSMYAAVQGIKNGSIAGVLGGVAGLAGGAANLGGMFGASSGFVNAATSVAKVAGTASAGYSALATGNFRDAAAVASNFFGGDTAKVVQTIDRVGIAADAFRRGDLVGAAGAGADLLGSLPGMEGNGTLRTIASKATMLDGAIDAVRDGRYGDAATFVTSGFGDALGLDAQGIGTVRTVAGAFDSMSAAGRFIDAGDYTGAATTLLGAASSLEPDHDARASLGRAADTASAIGDVLQAFDRGDLAGAADRAVGLLKLPIDPTSRAVVLEVLGRIENVAAMPAAA